MDFSSDSAFYSVGVWMGTQVSGTIPTDASSDPEDLDGSALHVSGPANPAGMDVYWHVGAPLDGAFRSVRFRAKTGIAGGQKVVVALAGSSSRDYFADLSRGRPWHAVELLLTQEWQTFEFQLNELRPLGPGEPAPTWEIPWSALHFIAAPDEPFDFWMSSLSFL